MRARNLSPMFASVVLVSLLGGCGRDERALPDPGLFGEPPTAPMQAAPTPPSAPPPQAKKVEDTAQPTPEPEPVVPQDSLLLGPCPLAGEKTSTCLREPEEASDEVRIAHVLIAWRGSTAGAPAHRDAKTAKRIALQLGHLARKQEVPFISLVRTYSDDPSEGVYVLDDHAEERFTAPFVSAGRRLAIGSVDVIKSRFGYHVLKRIPLDTKLPTEELPDLVKGGCPAMGEDPARCGAARPSKAGWTAPKKVTVEQVWIAYRGAQGRRRVTRSREEALALAVRIVHNARVASSDYKVLQRRYSDDPGDGRYEVTANSELLAPFVRMSMRLPPGGVDLVETTYGFHVLRRVR